MSFLILFLFVSVFVGAFLLLRKPACECACCCGDDEDECIDDDDCLEGDCEGEVVASGSEEDPSEVPCDKQS